MVTFGNPAGLSALLAIPAIIAIHFLQRESRRLTISTLFLLDQLAPESAEGRRFERLRNSVPLWLQIAATLFLTWIIVQPRWLRSDSVQHVVIVLDSSISLSAFHDELLKGFNRTTTDLSRAAGKTEWQLIESDASRPTLYSGIDHTALLEALRGWKPHLGAHDFLPALQAARSLLGGTGTLIFVSDRPCELPDGVRLLAVGHPIENCGFCGLTIRDREWRTLVRNYGTTGERRKWWMEANGQRSPEQEIDLPAGQSISLVGQIPAGTNSCELFMDADSFPIDDRLPILLPEPKHLRLEIQPNTPLSEFFEQLRGSIESAETSVDKPDLQFRVYDSTESILPNSNAIVFAIGALPGNEVLPGIVTAGNETLTKNLNWSGLLCRYSLRVPEEPGDQILVWQGARPLIFLREKPGYSLLVVNFDLAASNATRMPAFILLLHRFVDRIRLEKTAYETRNFDTNEPVRIATENDLPPPTIDNQPSGPLSAPAEPAFFDVKQGGKVLLRGASQFADSREADFRKAGSLDQVHSALETTIARNSQADMYLPIWLLAMAATMVASWTWRKS